MFTPVSDAPVPYALRADRVNEPPTLFHLTPQTAGKTQSYLTRYATIASKGSTNDPARGERLTRFDREHVLSCLTLVENAYAVGDEVSDAEGLAKIVGQLDFNSLQELITAAQSMTALKEQEKNS